MHRPKTVDVLGRLLYCIFGRYVRSEGFTGSGTRQRNQLANISLEDAIIARITTVLASPAKPVNGIDARRLATFGSTKCRDHDQAWA